MAGRGTSMTVDELLAQARAMLPYRPSPAEALDAQARMPTSTLFDALPPG